MIEKIDGFDNLEYLKEVYLQNTLQLKDLSFKNLPKLEKVFLENSAVETMHFCDLDGIEHLDLMKLPQLKQLTFSGSFKNLKKISFDENNNINIQGLDELLSKKKSDNEHIEVIGRPALKAISDKDIGN